MDTWIIVLICIAILLVILQFVIFLLLFLRINETLQKVNSILKQLDADLPEILENIKIITLKAKIASQEMEKGVKQVSKLSALLLPINYLIKLINIFRGKIKQED